MKTWTGIVIALLSLLAMGAKSQEHGQAIPGVFADFRSYRECNTIRCEKRFLGSLEYPASEIVEAGLAQIAMIKLAQPEASCARLKDKVDELAMHGETPAVRFKAYLTSMVFEHPEMFVYEKYGTYTTGDQFFTALADRLQKQALAIQ